MKEYYQLSLPGMTRELKLYPVNESLKIAAFILFGDVELTEKCAAALLEKCPDFDILITAESKGIPLAYEMARLKGQNEYVVARKKPKVYMEDVTFVSVNSITTQGTQQLCLGKREADQLRGKKVLLLDDVISTGDSILSLQKLVEKVGGEVVGKAAVLAEGDAAGRDDIIYLSQLPLFNAEGEPLL